MGFPLYTALRFLFLLYTHAVCQVHYHAGQFCSIKVDLSPGETMLWENIFFVWLVYSTAQIIFKGTFI